jgi:alcohol dehydrogenase class IV
MWQFSSPEIIFGEDALSRLAEIQGQRVVIVTDNTLVEAGFDQLLLERLAPADVKHELFGDVQPTLILVDPILTREMPRQLTADTGMDVISHAIEAFTGAWHNDFSDGLSLQALRLAFRYLPQAWKDGADEVAREHMHNAATIAGLAITNSSIALGHALAHPLGVILSLPHGRAIGMMLPTSMAFTANGGGTRYQELADSLGLAAESEAEGLVSLLKALQDLSAKLSLPATIREMGVDEADFEAALPDLAAGAEQDHQMLTTLRVPDEQELIRLYRCAYDGREVDF